MSDFYKTRMGQQFYERTMPDLVSAIERLAASIADLSIKKHDRDDEQRDS